uniref:IncA protein n=1 Tax=Steinernema glaseri TaxID=37863 RepID=A0A1I8AT85_9BILA
MYQHRRPPPTTLDTIVELSGTSGSDETSLETPTTALLDDFEVEESSPLLDRRLGLLLLGSLLTTAATGLWILWHGIEDGSVVTVTLVVLSGWLLVATCIVGSRNLFARKRERYLRGEADQFSEYVKRVTNPELMKNSTVIGTGKPILSLWFHPRKGVFV